MVIGTATMAAGLAGAKSAWNWYQKEKQNKSGLIGKLSNIWGNHIQKKINSMNDGWLKDTFSTVNETVFNPSKTINREPKSESKLYRPADPVNGSQKQVSYNSNNASYNTGEGALYGTKPVARGPYESSNNIRNDYVSDLTNIQRKMQNAHRARAYRMF